MYCDDDMLMLSGIQHFKFCPRQWALIHMEQLWEDNLLTMEGNILHNHVDDSSYRQKCGDYISLKSVHVASRKLGLYGITDVVELHPAEDKNNSISHPKYQGLWMPYPVEYKHGKPKKNEIDEVQLAAQVICLEEQYNINIRYAAFFYAEIRHRLEVEITDELRAIVLKCARDMHKVFDSKILPSIREGQWCKRCSLINVCMPYSSKGTKVSQYLKKELYEETT